MAYIRVSTSKRILGVDKKEIFPIGEIQAQLFIRRLELNIDRVVLADKTGYDPHTVERWELRRCKISVHRLEDWANGLGYNLEFRLSEYPLK